MNFAGRALYYWDRLFYYLSFLVSTATRFVVGMGFYLTGKGKFEHLDGVAEFFKSLNIPHPELQANLVAHLEYYGGIAIMAGVLTRFFASGLAVSMIVALMTTEREDTINAFRYLLNYSVPEDFSKVPTDITAFAYLALLAWLIFFGAGVLSVDYWAGRWIRQKLGITQGDTPTLDLTPREKISA
ncbi:MAG: DoxX family protein [Armatimonadetes bacterium]|nr:DoxX family protein [Armatimonadota bacterium]